MRGDCARDAPVLLCAELCCFLNDKQFAWQNDATGSDQTWKVNVSQKHPHTATHQHLLKKSLTFQTRSLLPVVWIICHNNICGRKTQHTLYRV